MERVTGGLHEVTEQSMIDAHRAGMTYWQRNKPRDADIISLEMLARSCGWHGEDNYAWIAGFLGAKRRDV